MTTVKSVIEGDNGHLIAEVARLWIKPGDRVLDLTYGRGKFWTQFEPQLLWKNDLYVDDPDFLIDFRHDYTQPMPIFHGIMDVVVFDPPYISTGSKATSTVPGMYEAYGIGNLKGYLAVFANIGAGISEARYCLKPGGRLLVKCMDYVESGSIRWGRRYVVGQAEHAGLVQVDEFVHHSGTGPQPTVNLDGTPRRQVHSRRAHSFLCVFQKGKR